MTIHRQPCPFCEATCGVVVEEREGIIQSVKGDPDDSFSKGYICPKAIALRDLHEDPDRLKKPLLRTGTTWKEIEWDAAFDIAAKRIDQVRTKYGLNALAVYQGNPTAHNLGLITHGQLFFRTLGTDNLFSITSADQLPQMLASEELYGHPLSIPVPDIDNTQYLLIFGANPIVSGGSLMTAPDMGRRLKALRERGGKLVVIDPRLTETAELCDQYYSIVPGTDVLMLLAMVNTIFAEKLVNLNDLDKIYIGLQELEVATRDFTPDKASMRTGITSENIKQLTREFAASDCGVCYGRVGVSTQAYGATCLWLINVLNILTGNLDKPGGSMFPNPAISSTLFPLPSFAEKRSRVRQAPSFVGEFPVAILAEEIETPGTGQIRSLITSAGNPVLSCPNGRRLDRAFSQLDFMVSIDFYLNETTRHAHLILPPTAPLERDHYDLAFAFLSVRNRAVYSPPMFIRKAWQRHDWEIIQSLYSRLNRKKSSILLNMALKLTPKAMLEIGLRAGPHGLRKGFSGLSISKLMRNPSGIDLGPLESRLPAILKAPRKKIAVASPQYLNDLQRAKELINSESTSTNSDTLPLLLIGRRHIQSNNSWLHNSPSLNKGPERCLLTMHPRDARQRAINRGSLIRIRSRTGVVEVKVEISEEIRQGVVVLPHGWGHKRRGVKLSLASKRPGVSANDLTDDNLWDELCGNAVFNGISVEVEKIASKTNEVSANAAIEG